MLLPIFQKPQIVRRYGTGQSEGGYDYFPFEDKTMLADVQVETHTGTMEEDGEDSMQSANVFSDAPFLVAVAGEQKADLLWYNGKWMECDDCVPSTNTPISHYKSHFKEIEQQPDPPESEGE